MRRAKCLAAPPVGRISIVLADASRDELDLDVPYIRTLELFCLRAGVNVLSLSARAVSGIAALAHRPSLIVLAGGQLDDHTVARWAYVIGPSAGPLPLAVYRRATQRPGATVLPTTPGEAQPRLMELADAALPEPVLQLAG